jgi:hypothetical protein
VSISGFGKWYDSFANQLREWLKNILRLVIKILTLFSAIGLLAAISVILRLWFKKHSRILILVIFGLSIYTFFQSTSMSRIPFELNRPPVTEMPADSVATQAD